MNISVDDPSESAAISSRRRIQEVICPSGAKELTIARKACGPDLRDEDKGADLMSAWTMAMP